MQKRVSYQGDVLRQLFAYDPSSGKLLWRDRPLEAFAHCKAPKRYHQRFANKFAGKEAGRLFKDGYRRVTVRGVGTLLVHRVVWALHHGTVPDEIDHINRDRSCNRLENLREANRYTNSLNTAPRHGLPRGIHYSRIRRKWRVVLRREGEPGSIGSFASLEQAVAARDAAMSGVGA